MVSWAGMCPRTIQSGTRARADSKPGNAYLRAGLGQAARRPRCRTRRTCASLLVALDVHPRVAMQILRHSQIAMMMEVYSEVPSAKTRSALKRLGRQLDG